MSERNGDKKSRLPEECADVEGCGEAGECLHAMAGGAPCQFDRRRTEDLQEFGPNGRPATVSTADAIKAAYNEGYADAMKDGAPPSAIEPSDAQLGKLWDAFLSKVHHRAPAKDLGELKARCRDAWNSVFGSTDGKADSNG